jgi:hypothetical protein
MVLRRQGEPGPQIGVWRMALALVVAAFLGGAAGLIWQSAGFGDDAEEDETGTVEPDATGAGD